MNWETIGLIIIIFVGYTYLLSVTRKKSVTAIVKLHVESREQNEDDGIPKEMEIYSKLSPFIITPVPGMEYMPADIEGAIIKRVIIDEQGGLEVICLLNVSLTDNQFNDTCKHLQKHGWHKKVYV